MSESIAALDLIMGAQTLEILRTPMEAMEAEDAPDIALVELANDIYTLGGRTLHAYSIRVGGALVSAASIDVGEVHPSHFEDCVRLVLGRASLSALNVPLDVMNGWAPPTFGIVQFGSKWRLGGDIIADYLEERGARTVRGSNLDHEGNNITGENSFN